MPRPCYRCSANKAKYNCNPPFLSPPVNLYLLLCTSLCVHFQTSFVFWNKARVLHTVAICMFVSGETKSCKRNVSLNPPQNSLDSCSDRYIYLRGSGFETHSVYAFRYMLAVIKICLPKWLLLNPFCQWLNTSPQQRLDLDNFLCTRQSSV